VLDRLILMLVQVLREKILMRLHVKVLIKRL
jgi:hypothetical protein